MAEKYVRCNSHCKYPAYDKEEVDTLLKEKANTSNVYTKNEMDILLENKASASNTYNKTEIDTKIELKQNLVLSGTEEPTSDLGTDGDIYLKYE